MFHSQCSAGDSMLSIVISIESAIQHSPVHRDNLTWNQPNPSAFTACVTVKVSENFVIYLRHHICIIISQLDTIYENNIIYYFGDKKLPSGTTDTEAISIS